MLTFIASGWFWLMLAIDGLDKVEIIFMLFGMGVYAGALSGWLCEHRTMKDAKHIIASLSSIAAGWYSALATGLIQIAYFSIIISAVAIPIGLVQKRFLNPRLPVWFWK